MNEPGNPTHQPSSRKTINTPVLGILSCALIPVEMLLLIILLNVNMGVFVTFFFILSVVIFPLAGLILGILDVRQKNKKKVLSIVGIVLNGLSLLGGLALSFFLVLAMLTLT